MSRDRNSDRHLITPGQSLTRTTSKEWADGRVLVGWRLSANGEESNGEEQ